MGLSPTIGADILEMVQDGQIETAEVSSLMTDVFSAALSGMVIMFGAKMFIKATNPPKKQAEEILEIAEML